MNLTKKTEANTTDFESWKDFVIANINSCKTTDNCVVCMELIKLFGIKFQREVPSNVFNEVNEKLWNRLNTKYVALKN